MDRPKLSTNHELTDYLDKYIEKPITSFGSAILLVGSWGSGKTWFIQQYISTHRESSSIAGYSFLFKSLYKSFYWIERQILINMGNSHDRPKESKIFYVSLYGVKNTAEVEERLIISVADRIDAGFNSEPFKYIYQAVSEYIKVINKIQISSFLPTRYFLQNNLSESILVFDDLERCSMDYNELFGLIDSYLGCKKCKIILIANENQIDESQKIKYNLIKEKLVSNTFLVVSDFDSVYNSFVDTLENEVTKKTLLLQQSKKIILELFQNHKQHNEYKLIDGITNIKTIQRSKDFEKYKDISTNENGNFNLRNLRQIVETFERIIIALTDVVDKKEKLLEDILKTLVILSIEIRSGRMHPSDIVRLEKASINLLSKVYRLEKDPLEDSDEDTKVLLQIVERWKGIIRFHESLPDLAWWQTFFEKGFIDERRSEKLRIDIDFHYNAPAWKRIFGYEYLSDEDFSFVLQDIELDYNEKKYKEIEVVKHVTGFFCR